MPVSEELGIARVGGDSIATTSMMPDRWWGLGSSGRRKPLAASSPGLMGGPNFIERTWRTLGGDSRFLLMTSILPGRLWDILQLQAVLVTPSRTPLLLALMAWVLRDLGTLGGA